GELVDIAVAEPGKTFARGGHKPFAIVIDDNRRILARQSYLRLQSDAAGGHVGGKQGMGGGKLRLMPEVEQRDLLAQEKRGADLLWGDSEAGHGWQPLNTARLDESPTGQHVCPTERCSSRGTSLRRRAAEPMLGNEPRSRSASGGAYGFR